MVELLQQNIRNYGEYYELISFGRKEINTKDITLENCNQHLQCILNILRDGIEDDFIHMAKVTVHFTDGVTVNLSIFDYVFNLIFWTLPLSVHDELTSEYLFFEENLTKNSIKEYIDTRFLSKHRTSYPNIELNNYIDDCLDKFKYIDEFSLYALNTINNEDSIDLMNSNKDFWDALHADLSGVPIEDVKKVRMDYTNSAIRAITHSSHCLRDSFRAGEGISAKQFKEFLINVGSKPDGNGGIFPTIVNNSYSNGGVNDVESFVIDSAVGQQALILQKQNVGKSGEFGRLLGLNNMGTLIHPDPNYICNTKNFEKIFIQDASVLKLFKNRYYRLSPNGLEYKTSFNPTKYNKDLIGKTVYFRSPMTCASAARGEGVCYRCYGGLAYTNNDINIGKLAAELLSAKLTQMLLSAKHILESLVQKLEWSEGFDDVFTVDYNLIRIDDDFAGKKYKLIISSDIQYESEDDDFDYNEYINSLDIMRPDGTSFSIYTANMDNIYLTYEFKELLQHKKDVDGMYIFDIQDLVGIDLFLVKLTNNELSRTLEGLKKLLNTNAFINSFADKDEFLQSMISALIAGGLGIDSVHAEVILANQLRDADDILKKPEWEYENAKYKMITLNTSLMDNPSVTVSLQYQKLSKMLFYPLTYKKTAPSPSDIAFMVQPQKFMNEELIDGDVEYEEEDNGELKNPLKYSK